MLRVTAPEAVTGRVVGLEFTDGVAHVTGPLSRPVDLYLRTHGYKVEGSDVPSESWRNDDIVAWATGRGIDLDGADTKADMLDAIDAATP